MNKTYFILILVFIIGCVKNQVASSNELTKQQPEVANMKLTSTAFTHNSNIPSDFTCDGKNTPPAFSISGVPKNAKSLAIIADDPDAVVGTFTHWVIWNIPASATEITNGNAPGSKLGNNGARKLGYIGPCPPSGTHRYFFKLYALNSTLNLPEGSTKKQVESAMQGHILAKTELIGLYKRK